MYIGTEEQRKKASKRTGKIKQRIGIRSENNGPFTQVYQKGLGKDPRTVEGQAGSCSNTALLVFS